MADIKFKNVDEVQTWTAFAVVLLGQPSPVLPRDAAVQADEMLREWRRRMPSRYNDEHGERRDD